MPVSQGQKRRADQQADAAQDEQGRALAAGATTATTHTQRMPNPTAAASNTPRRNGRVGAAFALGPR